MLTRRSVFVAGLLAALPAAAAGETQVRVLAATDVRAGPGAHYAQDLRLLPGAGVKPLERRGGWVLAQVKDQRGWIPTYVLESEQSGPGAASLLRAASKDLLRTVSKLLAGGDRPAYLTRVQAASGIRGFAEVFVAHRGQKENPEAPALWESTAFAPGDYDAFLGSRFGGRDWESFKRRLPLDTPAPLPDADADRLGGALAAVLAGQYRLLRKPALERYLSLVATLVAASSHAYEVPVRAYVIDSPQPLGYVTPNGIVFVSTGALARMHSEAEFAFFVGHEIAHIAFGHGARKVKRDEQRHQEEAAFVELEQDLGWDTRQGDKYVRTNAELSELADQIYEYFQREANDRDELEADRWGLIYAARAGYVPEAAEGVLARIATEKAAADSGLLWRGTDAKPRLAGVRRTVTTITIERTEFRVFEDEFRDATRK